MYYNPFTLEGKTILVTGASSGIGRAIAIECSKMGATLVLSGRNEDRLNDTFSQLNQGNHIKMIGDITHHEVQAKIVELCPVLQGIVHCAGMVKTLLIKFATEDALFELMNTNLFAPVLITKGLLRAKKIDRSGSIVFISSLGARIANSGNGIYSATKGAINSIAKTLALEVSPLKIRVNCILPGMINTELLNSFSVTQEQLDKDRLKYTFGYGDAEDVAYAAIYLLSNAAKWMTGSEIVLDGGLTLQ
jgi:NAD(P)-dependent dehydrogenase (short-subunit alcohol dehydrogenase family)